MLTARTTGGRGGGARLGLVVGSIGVVFGDIGTSPLYAFQQIFAGPLVVEPFRERVLGAASLVFWTLMLIVTIKYVLIVMRADNEGEGGVMALASLATSGPLRSPALRAGLMAVGIAGAALFFGDGMITPAVSVLSAVEGLEVVDPALVDLILPIAIAVLVGLFVVQRHGTHRVGRAFGPIMLVWFAAVAVLGLTSLARTPEVLEALSPVPAARFLVGDPLPAFLALASVVLCVTGAEALYADMGHFGRGPIRLSWAAIVGPALVLTYFGQAALVLRDPAAVSNPFYLLVPDALRLPMVLLATVATVIASQAVISGAFSMTRQAVHLGYLPRMTIRHTSAEQRGQVYVPLVNWLLLCAVIVLVLGFRSSDRLASAYGIAVTGTFIVTSTLITVVALTRWRTSPWVVWPLAVFFLVIDGSFFVANLTKFTHGGWFPLALAAVVFVVLTTWRRGRTLVESALAAQVPEVQDLPRVVAGTPGLSRPAAPTIYVTRVRGVPHALMQHIERLHALPDPAIIISLRTQPRPTVPEDGRMSLTHLGLGIHEIVLRVGFSERPDVPATLRRHRDALPFVDPDTCCYVLSRVEPVAARDAPMWMPLQHLYAAVQRLAADPALAIGLPAGQVLESGIVVPLDGARQHPPERPESPDAPLPPSREPSG